MSDTIVKIANKTENFTIVSNEVPRDNTLSARAKGIYFYLMTLPANWVIHKEEIYTHFTEGRDALDTAWGELLSAGYIEKEVLRDNGRIVSNSWKIYESSRITEKPNQGKPVTGKPSDGKPVTGNPQLLSTNELSTDKQSTNNEPAKKQRKKTVKKDKGEYKPYGKNNKVFFYDEEYEQLVKEHGEDKIYTAIDIVDDYLIKNPAKTYTNFVRVFSAWALEEADRRLKQSFFRTSSIPKTSTAPAPDIVCCGEHYDWDIGFCKQCGKKYNREGKVI